MSADTPVSAQTVVATPGSGDNAAVRSRVVTVTVAARDRGDVSLEHLVISTVMTFGIFAVLLSLKFGVLHGLLWTGIGAAGLIVVVAGGLTAEHVTPYLHRRALREWEPLLREWYGLRDSEVVDEFVTSQWRRAQRRGVTPADAARWSAAGYSPDMAAAAHHTTITPDQVDQLAEVVREADLWDGVNRRALDLGIAWDIEPPGPAYWVLKDWMALPIPTIRAAFSEARAAGSWFNTTAILYDLTKAAKKSGSGRR